MKPRLLDLFSGAGGAACGYQRAGFHVTGIDIKPQPRYCGDAFIQSDALEYLAEHGREFDAIHASPPCQGYTLMNNRNPEKRNSHPRLIEHTRDLLRGTGRPYVIENVVGAPLENPIRLCGSAFGLGVRRHRLFESNILLISPGCCHRRQPDHAGVYGQYPDGGRLWTRQDGHAPLRRAKNLHDGQERMGIDWMEWSELTQAIPPAYTEFLGRQLMQYLEVQHVSL